MLYVTSVYKNGDDTFFSSGFAFECKLSEHNCTSFFKSSMGIIIQCWILTFTFTQPLINFATYGL